MSEINRWSISAGGSVQNAAGYFPEGQAPSTVNDAARTIMGELRRDWQTHNPDVTATFAAQTYTVTYDRDLSSGELSGVYCFIPGGTNTGTASISINGVITKTIAMQDGRHLPASVIVAQRPAWLTYDKSLDKVILLNPAPGYSPINTLPVNTSLASTDLVDAWDVSAGARVQLTVANAGAAFKGSFGTIWTSTSGTSNDWTIASTARRITIIFNGVSLSGNSDLLVQLGDSGGVEATGYTSTETRTVTANTVSIFTSTAGFLTTVANSGRTANGIMTLMLLDSGSGTWAAKWDLAITSGPYFNSGAGLKAVSNAPVTTLRVTTANGTDTFDAGSINIYVE